MTIDRPDFVPQEAEFNPTTVRFNAMPVAVYRTYGDPRMIRGWVDNPRVEMIINRWRLRGHRSSDAYPDDDELLNLMLDDDVLNRRARNRAFDIQELGEDVKLNGVREPLIVTWNGKLLDGNRRKFAVMWALSDRGGANPAQRQLLQSVPMLVLPMNASQSDERVILIQENYADSLKRPWPQVITNGALYEKYQELSEQLPNEPELEIRKRLRDEFPRFSTTEIRDRVETWQLTLEFRGDYIDDLDDDELARLINDRFQYFRQAHDTFRGRDFFNEPEFRGLLFKGIHHGLFPSFASVRNLEDIYRSPRATDIFLRGEGMSSAEKRANFRAARDEAGRERAEKELSVENRLESMIDFLDGITSTQLANLSVSMVERLQDVLQRVIAQAEASPDVLSNSIEK